MPTGSFTEHAKACPHVEQIEQLYAPIDVIHLDSQFGPSKDGVKRAMVLGEMSALYQAYGCSGPVEGETGCDGVINKTCPLLEKKTNSYSRQRVAVLGNKILRVLNGNRG